MVTVDGQIVHCETHGSGAPILFLHGNPDTSRIWGRVVSHLQSRYRCIVPDLPGFDGSGIDLDRFDFSLSGLARWVNSLVQAVQPSEPLHLVVHARPLNAALSPNDEEVRRAEEIVNGFEAARAQGEDRALVDGLWVEVPTYRNARRLVERARRLNGRGN